MHASIRLSRRSATAMAIVAAVTVLLAVFAGAAAGTPRQRRPARQHRPGPDLDPAVQLPGPDHRRFPAAQPAAHDRADAGEHPQHVRDAAPHRLPPVRELRRDVGLDRRRVPQGVPQLQAAGRRRPRQPGPRDLRRAARPGQDARAQVRRLRRLAAAGQHEHARERARDRQEPQRARQEGARPRAEGLRPQPRRRVPRPSCRTTSTATASPRWSRPSRS